MATSAGTDRAHEGGGGAGPGERVADGTATPCSSDRHAPVVVTHHFAQEAVVSREIRVERGKAPTWRGELTYKGNIHMSVNCYWNPGKRIPAYDSTVCSKTFMDTKKNSAGTRREAIFLPSVPGFRGIFIHYGKNLNKVDQVCIWSDGCIVLDEAHLLAIWNDITPLNGHNVRVTVVDE